LLRLSANPQAARELARLASPADTLSIAAFDRSGSVVYVNAEAAQPCPRFCRDCTVSLAVPLQLGELEDFPVGGGERQSAQACWTTPAIVHTIGWGTVLEFGLVNVEQEPVSGDGMSDLTEAGEFLRAHPEMLAEECVGIGWLRPNLEGWKTPQARIPFGFPLASDQELRAVPEEEDGKAANRGDGA